MMMEMQKTKTTKTIKFIALNFFDSIDLERANKKKERKIEDGKQKEKIIFFT